jgi:hypothetical protein
MSVNKAVIMVSAITLDENCNVKECINCNEEFIKNARQKCMEMKNNTTGGNIVYMENYVANENVVRNCKEMKNSVANK